jgi:hypothetical protein
MEVFGARPEAPLATCLEAVRDADVVILIVGPRYGSPVPGEGLSYTHREFREAIECGIPVLALIVPPQTEPPLSDAESRALTAFRAEVEEAPVTVDHLESITTVPESAIAALARLEQARASLPAQFCAFQSQGEYFAALTHPDALFNHTHALVGRTKELKVLEDFLSSPTFAAVLSGAGGVGKSRLLLEFARRHASDPWTIMFLGSMFEMRPEYLRTLPKRPVCVVVDDAHRLASLDTLVQVFRGTCEEGAEVKLLLTCRPSGLARIRSAFRNLPGHEATELPELQSLDPTTSARELALQTLGSESKVLAARLADLSDGNPLLLTVGALLLRARDLSPEILSHKPAFQEAALDCLLEGIPDTLDGDVRTRPLLSLLAAVGPVRPAKEPIAEMLGKHLATKPSSVAKALVSLRDKYRVLSQRGFTMRLNPDVLGDHLLYEAAVAGGRPSGFLNEVVEEFSEPYLSNILANASELEWRCKEADTPVDVAGGLWQLIRQALAGIGYRGRVFLMKRVEAAAWFDAAQAWTIVCWVLENPAAPEDPLEECWAPKLRTTRVDVERQAARLLRIIAWDPQLTQRSCRTLWLLGQDDGRALNATPDHPIRILADTLAFDPRRSMTLQARAVDGLQDALSSPGAVRERSVSDAVTSLLSRELEWSTSDGATITIRSAPLDALNESVRTLRQRAIDMLEREAATAPPKLAVKAIDALAHLLIPPLGMFNRQVPTSEIQAWEPEVRAVAQKLVGLATTARAAVVMYYARKAIRQAPMLPWPAVARDVASAIRELTDPEEFKWFDALRPYDPVQDAESGWQAAESKMRDRMRQIADDLWASACSSSQVIDTVCRAATALGEAGLQYSSWLLLDCLCELRPREASLLAATVLDGPCRTLKREHTPLYSRWFEREPDICLSALRRHIDEDFEDTALGIALAYQGNWLGHPQVRSPEHLANIQRLLSSTHRDVRMAAAPALRHARGQERETAKVLIETDFRDDERFVDEILSCINERYGIQPTELSSDDFRAILLRLVSVHDISERHYHIDQFLSLASERCPDAVVDFFLARIDHAVQLSGSEAGDFRPLPLLGLGQAFAPLHKAATYKAALRRIRDKALESEPNYRFWIPQLYAYASQHFCSDAVEVLSEWSASGDPERVAAAARLTAEDEMFSAPGSAKAPFVFEHSGFVRDLLRRAETLGSDCLKSCISSFRRSAVSLSYSHAIGEPPQEILQRRDEAHRLSIENQDAPTVSEFYGDLARDFERTLDEIRLEDEEIG